MFWQQLRDIHSEFYLAKRQSQYYWLRILNFWKSAFSFSVDIVNGKRYFLWSEGPESNVLRIFPH